MIPVVDPGADDDHALTAGRDGGIGPLVGKLLDGVAGDAGEQLLPRRGIGSVAIVVVGGILAGETTRDAVLRHDQVVDRGHQRRAAVGGGDAGCGHPTQGDGIEPPLRELGLHDLFGPPEQGQDRIVGRVVGDILQLHVPVALLLVPAGPGAALRDHQLAGGGVDVDELPVSVGDVLVGRNVTGAEKAAGLEVVTRRVEAHQVGAVGVLLDVLQEVGRMLFVVVLLQDDVCDRHPESAVAAGVDRDPLVGVLADLAEVRREDHRLGTVVAGLREEVAVRGPRHVQTRAHVRDHLGVVPVRALADVGLLAPDLREGGRQIAIPVVEAQVDAAEQLQEAPACGIAEH